MTFNELVGKRISDLLKAKNLKQVDLVDNNILKASHISHIIRGNAGISLAALVFVCDKLEISLSDFFQPFQGDRNLSPVVSHLLEDCRNLDPEDAETVHVLAQHLLVKKNRKIPSLATSFPKPVSDENTTEEATDNEGEEPKYYLPLLGGAAAGSPIYHPADDGDQVEIPERYADPERYAVFQARGDSMEPKIPDGAFVIVEITATPLDGEMAVVMLCSFSDAEYVVKRVYVRGQKMILRSYNRKYMDMTVTADEVRSVYRVVDVVR